jgi:hypothetical protein
MYQLSGTYNDKTNEMSYLQAQIQTLEGYVNRLKKNHNQQQEEEIQKVLYLNGMCVYTNDTLSHDQ